MRLRAIEPQDASVFFVWNLDSERARLLDFVWPPQSHASVEAWAAQQALKKFEGGDYHWLVENLEGLPVGSISTHNCDRRCGTFAYGVDIAEEHRRKGYAGAAIRLVLRYYFEEMRYQKVTVTIYAGNLASIALHEGLGFQCEGRLRRMALSEGRFIDVLYYGLTAEEFKQRLSQK